MVSIIFYSQRYGIDAGFNVSMRYLFTSCSASVTEIPQVISNFAVEIYRLRTVEHHFLTGHTNHIRSGV